MSELQRYRVTGGVFLIAVAVIVLPMLFDGRGIEPDSLPPIEKASMELAALPALQLDEVALARADALRDSVDDEGFHRDTNTRVGNDLSRSWVGLVWPHFQGGHVLESGHRSETTKGRFGASTCKWTIWLLQFRPLVT